MKFVRVSGDFESDRYVEASRIIELGRDGQGGSYVRLDTGDTLYVRRSMDAIRRDCEAKDGDS